VQLITAPRLQAALAHPANMCTCRIPSAAKVTKTHGHLYHTQQHCIGGDAKAGDVHTFLQARKTHSLMPDAHLHAPAAYPAPRCSLLRPDPTVPGVMNLHPTWHAESVPVSRLGSAVVH
jgi:hypothetical protein